MKSILSVMVLVAAVCFAQSPSKAEAQSCVSNVWSGLSSLKGRDFIFTTQDKNANTAIFQQATLRYSSATQVYSWGSRVPSYEGLHSNKVDDGQPFDTAQESSRKITLSSSGSLLIENFTSNTSETVTSPTCFGNAIVWSTSTRVYVLTYNTAVYDIVL